jgi:hypothetical protein
VEVSDHDLEAIKARADAADDGPWTVHPFHEVWSASNLLLVEDCYTDANAAFIAHARTDVPTLLGIIERLRDMVVDAQTEAEMQAAEVERLRVEVDYYKPLGQQFLERVPEFGKCLKELERLRAERDEWRDAHQAEVGS